MNLQKTKETLLKANMNMTGLFLTNFLIMTQCGCAFGSFISQLESAVRVQPGISTSLECHIQLDGHFYAFWIKFPLAEAPVCIATVKAFAAEVTMCEKFKNHSKIKATWNKNTFKLSFTSVEQTDVATYFCGTYNFGEFFFGKGTKLILEEHADAVSPNTPFKDNEKKDGKMQVFEYLVPALATTNVASIFIIIWLCLLSKNRSGVPDEAKDADDKKTEEVNYAALTFGNKQRRTVQKITSVDGTVIYGAVRHQEEL